MAALLQISALSKSFQDRSGQIEALVDLDITIQPNRFVTLVGPSGCGKSTLLRIISGIDRPSSGTLQINGEVVEQHTQRTGRFGYMPQRDALLPWRTVMQNLLLGPEIDGRDIAEARNEAEQLIPLFGLAGFEERYPSALSGGMRQRAALLRTFLTGRDMLLLDEPFGALDAITRRELQAWLLEISEMLQKTVLFITHDIDEALFLGDRVLVMSPRPGRITLDLAVPFKRPRTQSILTTPSFMEMKQVLLNELSDGSSFYGET